MIYEFTPTQDLHGYNEPWAPGAGKNLANIAYGNQVPSISTGDMVNVNGWSTDFMEVDNTKDYVMSSNLDIATYILFYGTGKTFLGFILTSAQPQRTYVLSAYDSWENVEYVKVRSDAGASANIEVQIELGTTPSSWSPYENICPISGYNIWDPDNSEMVQVYSGYVDANANKLYLHHWYTEYNDEELEGPWMSSMDKYTEEGTPTEGAFVVDMGGELTEVGITDFMLQTLLDSLGVRRFITSGAMLLNSLMDQAQGRVRSEEELLNRSLPLHVIAIGEDLPTNLTIKKPVSDVLPGLPGKIKI